MRIVTVECDGECENTGPLDVVEKDYKGFCFHILAIIKTRRNEKLLIVLHWLGSRLSPLFSKAFAIL